MMSTSSRLEIQPDRYAIVVGPRFAAQVVKETLDVPANGGVRLPTFEFSAIMDHGVAFLLDRETFSSDAERSKFEVRYKNAYELDPAFVLRKIVSSITTAGRYEEWLSELFACDYQPRVPSRSVQRLLALQDQGALLVYVHCDDILARAAGLQPVLMENDEQMDRWARGECAGFLHLHGVYSKPNSVQLDCQLYDNVSHPLYATAERLKQVLSTRNTILLGDDWEQLSSDPLLANFCKRFVSESAGRHSFVFGAADTSSDLPGLPVCAAAPFPTVSPLTESSVDLWKQIDVAPASKSGSSEHQVLCLLVSNQAGAREISHMMFNAPGVNFALVNPATYGDCTVFGVSIRVESGSLRQLWHWLFSSSQDTLLARGLLGFALHGGTFLWLRDPTTSSTHGSVGHPAVDSPLSKGSLAANVENTIVNSYATLTNGCPPDTNNQRNDIHSSPPLTSASTPSSPPRAVGGGEVRHNKIIQRYKVVKKRSQIKISTPADMYPYAGHLMTKACEDVGMLLPPAPYSMYARRGSLPPIKTGEAGNALALLAERLQQTADTGPSQVPSYVAIKRALLSDKFKHTQNPISRLVAPKALLNLLQSKKLSVDLSQRPNLLAHRRNSDPGSYLQHRDKTRRRQLFLDENRLWIKTYGSVIERKIQGWKQKRLQRLQREYFYAQHELAACHKQNGFRILSSLNSSPQLVASPLHSALASSTSSSIPSSLQQAFLTAAAGSSVNSFSPAHLMFQLSNTTVAPAPMLLSTHPFISPYTLMGSYATLPVTAAAAQPTAAYIVPPSVLAAAAGAQQKVVFLPSTSSVPVNTSSSGTTARLPMASVSPLPDTKPPFSSLLAPAATLPVASHTKPEPQTRSHHPPPPLTPASESAGSKKRKNTFPEKLSSLLQPLSKTDPDSPPAVKRICSASQPTVTFENTGHVSAFHSSTSSPPSYGHHHTSHSHRHHLEHSVSSSQSHHEHHHYSHHLNSTHSHHHHSHHSTSHHHHNHNHHHSPSPPSHTSHTSPSPLEQCLLQPPASPQLDSRAPDSPGGSPYLFSPPSPTNCSAQNHPQLWQFLLELLLTANCSHLIEWANGGQEYEFTIRDPAQVALLWGKCSNNSAMNYDKLARGLRYYYAKGIIVKVEGKKLTFRYNGLAKSYVQRRCGLAVDMTGSMDEMVVVE